MGLLDDAQNLASGSDPASQETLQILDWENQQIREFIETMVALGIRPKTFPIARQERSRKLLGGWKSEVVDSNQSCTGWPIQTDRLYSYSTYTVAASFDLHVVVTTDAQLAILTSGLSDQAKQRSSRRELFWDKEVQQPFHKERYGDYSSKGLDHQLLFSVNNELNCGSGGRGSLHSHSLACYLKVAIAQRLP